MDAYCMCDYSEPHPTSECVAPWESETDIVQRDFRALLNALDLGDHARPYSPHAVMHREVLPAIAALKGGFEVRAVLARDASNCPDCGHPSSSLAHEEACNA